MRWRYSSGVCAVWSKEIAGNRDVLPQKKGRPEYVSIEQGKRESISIIPNQSEAFFLEEKNEANL